MADSILADMHAHPGRFHRAHGELIEKEVLLRYKETGIDVVVCAVSTDAPFHGRYAAEDGKFVPAGEYSPQPGEVFAFTRHKLRKIGRSIESGDAAAALSPHDVIESKKEGLLALLASIEGADGVEGDLDNLDVLYADGVRLVQLVHFRSNAVGSTQTPPGQTQGLTEFGRELIHRCNRIGIIVDLAHANTRTIFDALEVSTAPMLFSHTGSRAVQEADRHLTDDEIAAIAEREGIVGVWPSGRWVPTMIDLVRHVEHVRDAGGIDHVGIGSDLGGMASYTEGFDPRGFLSITDALLDADFTEEDVGKVLGGNFMRAWSEIADSGVPTP